MGYFHLFINWSKLLEIILQPPLVSHNPPGGPDPYGTTGSFFIYYISVEPSESPHKPVFLFFFPTGHKARGVSVTPPHSSPVGDFRLHQQVEDDREQVVCTYGLNADCRGKPHILSSETLKTKQQSFYTSFSLHSSCCVVLTLPKSLSLCPGQMTKLATWQTLIRSGSYHATERQWGCCWPISLDFQSKLDKHIRVWQRMHCPMCWSDYRLWAGTNRPGRSSVGLSREKTSLHTDVTKYYSLIR